MKPDPFFFQYANGSALIDVRRGVGFALLAAIAGLLLLNAVRTARTSYVMPLVLLVTSAAAVATGFYLFVFWRRPVDRPCQS